MDAIAEVVLPCREIDATITFFVDRLGFRLHSIFPADAPAIAVVVGHGLRLRLDRDAVGSPGRLRLIGDHASAGELTAPNGTVVELALPAQLEVPALEPSLVVQRLEGDADWQVGRAGMRYRDLIPGRQGGRFIASHIRIPGGGPVPDYAHYHHVRFQLIYCYRGWVRVVYQDQGPPFVLEAGDCVLQPPEIRHRVLESSPDLEVIEVGCPAAHQTHRDHELALPTADLRPDRDFGGQRFVRHIARDAPWKPVADGFEARDTGIAAATGGLAGARVLRPLAATGEPRNHQGELQLWFVLAGSATLLCANRAPQPLTAGDACTVPAAMKHRLVDRSDDLELFEVTAPAA